jgi:O-methyltransferase involved in polyketide biosynthesis
MAARKRRALKGIGSLSDHHEVRILDALKDDGPESLTAITAELDHEHGLAIITEGLLGYLPDDDVEAIWRRFARALAGFPVGRYISDLHLAGVQTVHVRAFRLVLGAFVRGRVYMHFEDAREGEAALHAAGFASATVERAAGVIRDGADPGNRMAHILEASTR